MRQQQLAAWSALLPLQGSCTMNPDRWMQIHQQSSIHAARYYLDKSPLNNMPVTQMKPMLIPQIDIKKNRTFTPAYKAVIIQNAKKFSSFFPWFRDRPEKFI